MAVKTKTSVPTPTPAPRIPAPASPAARASGTRPSASAAASRLAVSPQAVSNSQQRRNTAQTPTPVPSAQKQKTPVTLPPGLNAKEKKDAGLIGRVLDTAPKFAEFVANQAAAGQISGKQLNDLAYIAKQGQVHGRTDRQVVTSLGKAMTGMQPSVQKVFWQEFGRAMMQDTGHNLKEFGVGVYTAGKESVSGAANAARHPVATARGMGTAIASGVVAGRKEVQLVGQAIGLGSGNAQAAHNQLRQQANAAGDYVTGIAADPRKIGAVTFNAAASVLPLPGARAAGTLAARAGATGAGKAALELLKPTLLKVGETVSLGRGLTGKISSLITGKDGKQYAYVMTAGGQRKVLANSLSSPSRLPSNQQTGYAYSVNNLTDRQSTRYGVNYFNTNQLRRTMSRTETGRKVVGAADSGEIDLTFSIQSWERGLEGRSYGNRAVVYIPETQNGTKLTIMDRSSGVPTVDRQISGYDHTAAVGVHEGLHAMGIAGSKRAEALVRLAELELHGVPIDRKAIRQVLSEINGAKNERGEGVYSGLPWQQGLTIPEFPNARF